MKGRKKKGKETAGPILIYMKKRVERTRPERRKGEPTKSRVFMCGNPHRSLTMRPIDTILGSTLSVFVTKEHTHKQSASGEGTRTEEVERGQRSAIQSTKRVTLANIKRETEGKPQLCGRVNNIIS